MRTLRVAALLLLVPLFACYHATIDTGLAPSGQVVKKAWAHAFIAGLVPPSVVETASRCPNGVAKVETKLSFLNQIVNAVTWAIYSPMTIEVQCAAARATASSTAPTVTVPAGATVAEKTQAVEKAADLSLGSGEAAFILFE